MGIKAHVTSDEEVVDHCTTDYWAWVCTDKRIIKYRSNDRGEEMEDISLDEITGISLTNTGKSDTLLGYTILSGVAFVLFFLFSAGDFPNPYTYISAIFGVMAYISYRRYQRSADSYFELRGTGLIQQEPERWRIQSNTNPDDVRSFVKTVRRNI